jgi:Domain of unknown function (DUF5666)
MGKLFVGSHRVWVSRLVRLAVGLAILLSISGWAAAQTAPAKTPPILGTIKSIEGSTVTVTNDAGTDSKVTVSDTTKLVRVPPGSKDLSQAVVIPLTEFHPGDRVLVSVRCAGDSSPCEASRIVAMKKSDITDKQAQEREAWRRGIGGLVKSMDAGQGTITIGTVTAAGKKDITVEVAKSTIVRRYAPGSVKFDDAKASALAEIQPGDQLRARGVRSADGSSFTADEIVTGAFLNIAGTISAMDAGAGTISVTDLATKKAELVKVGQDTQLRKLPANMAQMIAMRLKGGAGGPQGSGAAGGGAAASAPGTASSGAAGIPGGGPGRTGGDFQQLLSRLPATPLTDFQKGDAVMIVATGSLKDAQVTAITILGGVEALLQGTTQEQASSILSPWSLSSGGGDAAAVQ